MFVDDATADVNIPQRHPQTLWTWFRSVAFFDVSYANIVSYVTFGILPLAHPSDQLFRAPLLTRSWYFGGILVVFWVAVCNLRHYWLHVFLYVSIASISIRGALFVKKLSIR